MVTIARIWRGATAADRADDYLIDRELTVEHHRVVSI
jgi:hypothetical protein